jgi:hypothetical protein
MSSAYITQAEMSRICGGVGQSAIHAQVRKGVLHLNKDGLLHREKSIDALLEHMRRGSKIHRALTAVRDGTAAPVAAAAPVGRPAFERIEQQVADAGTFNEARLAREQAEAGIAKLKHLEMEGTLMRVDAFETVVGTALASMREHVLQVRARLAPLLAAETDPKKVDLMLGAELSQALEFMASVKLS